MNDWFLIQNQHIEFSKLFAIYLLNQHICVGVKYVLRDFQWFDRISLNFAQSRNANFFTQHADDAFSLRKNRLRANQKIAKSVGRVYFCSFPSIKLIPIGHAFICICPQNLGVRVHLCEWFYARRDKNVTRKYVTRRKKWQCMYTLRWIPNTCKMKFVFRMIKPDHLSMLLGNIHALDKQWCREMEQSRRCRRWFSY